MAEKIAGNHEGTIGVVAETSAEWVTLRILSPGDRRLIRLTASQATELAKSLLARAHQIEGKG